MGKAKVRGEDLADAMRLKELWKKLKPMGQEEFGDRYEMGSQGNVTQYLNGHIPLNLRAASNFPHALGVGIEQFSPRLAATAAQIKGGLDPVLSKLIELYFRLSEDARDTLLGNATRLYAQEQKELSTVKKHHAASREQENSADKRRHVERVR